MIDIEEIKPKIERLCRRLPVKRLGLFGSALSQNFSQSSDIDVLVIFDSGEDIDLFDKYFELKEQLEEIFKREVDLVVDRKFKNPVLREAIDRARIVIYERWNKKHLIDILQAAEEIQSFVFGMDFEAYQNKPVTKRAVERDFEIIGEALNRTKNTDNELPEKISEQHRIIGFRNILIRGYDNVDEAIVWQAVTKHLPILIREVKEILSAWQIILNPGDHINSSGTQ